MGQEAVHRHQDQQGQGHRLPAEEAGEHDEAVDQGHRPAGQPPDGRPREVVRLRDRLHLRVVARRHADPEQRLPAHLLPAHLRGPRPQDLGTGHGDHQEGREVGHVEGGHRRAAEEEGAGLRRVDLRRLRRRRRLRAGPQRRGGGLRLGRERARSARDDDGRLPGQAGQGPGAQGQGRRRRQRTRSRADHGRRRLGLGPQRERPTRHRRPEEARPQRLRRVPPGRRPAPLRAAEGGGAAEDRVDRRRRRHLGGGGRRRERLRLGTAASFPRR